MMDSGIIVTSLAIGAAIFAGLVIFWFFNAYAKRKLGADQSVQLATTSQKSNGKEKRQHPRVAISWPAMLEPPYEHLQVQLKDISLGGAFVVCRKRAGGLVKCQCPPGKGDPPRHGCKICSKHKQGAPVSRKGHF